MKKILFVDDDPNILAALERQFRRELLVETALGPDQGLTALESGDDYAVVVSDMRMPGMSGLKFLRRVHERRPDLACVILTGNADRSTAIDAINEGAVFRFLLKPCPHDDLVVAIRAAFRHHERLVAERELLEKTLRGCVDTLSEVLSLKAPGVFLRSRRVRDSALRLARELELTRLWELEVAALLARIGSVAVPRELLQQTDDGGTVSEEAAAMLSRIPELGARLLAHIPRMEPVCQTIAHQEASYGAPPGATKAVHGDAIPVHARVLKLVSDFVDASDRLGNEPAAWAALRHRFHEYDPAIFAAAEKCLVRPSVPKEAERLPRAAKASELEEGMVLAADATTLTGLLIAPSGTRMGLSLLHTLRNFAALRNLREPIQVVPGGG